MRAAEIGGCPAIEGGDIGIEQGEALGSIVKSTPRSAGTSTSPTR
jgi:hypothetical protein